MSERINIPSIIGEAVTQTSLVVMPQIQAYLSAGINQVTYLNGHPAEIIQTLADRDKSQKLVYQRYPLIAAFQDVPEKDIGGIWEANLQFIIANITKPEYKEPERKEKNFLPILYPIYNELFEQLKKHKNVLGFYINPGNVYDRAFWGTTKTLLGNDTKIFNDYLDAIEIQNCTMRFQILEESVTTNC